MRNKKYSLKDGRRDACWFAVIHVGLTISFLYVGLFTNWSFGFIPAILGFILLVGLLGTILHLWFIFFRVKTDEDFESRNRRWLGYNNKE